MIHEEREPITNGASGGDIPKSDGSPVFFSI